MTHSEAEDLAAYVAAPEAKVEIEQTDWLDEDSWLVRVSHPDHDTIDITDPDERKAPDWIFRF